MKVDLKLFEGRRLSIEPKTTLTGREAKQKRCQKPNAQRPTKMPPFANLQNLLDQNGQPGNGKPSYALALRFRLHSPKLKQNLHIAKV